MTYYAPTGAPPAQLRGTSSTIRNEFQLIAAAFTSAAGDINARGMITGQSWSGTHDFTAGSVKVPTLSYGASGGYAASVDYVNNAAFQAVLPGQTGSAGMFLTTNGTIASWAFPGISNVGSTITGSTTLIGAYLIVPVAMATGGQSVTLPNATTLQKGPPLYIMRNTGALQFNLRDNAGTLIASVPPRGEIIVVLMSNSNAAGSWAIGNASEFGFLSPFFAGVSTIIESTTDTGISFAPLSATQFIATWNHANAPYYPMACVCTVTGNTISFGSVVTIAAEAGYGINVAALSATQAIVVYQGASQYVRSCILNISGSVITPVAAVTVDSSFPSNQTMSIVALSATQALIAYTQQGSGTGYIKGCVLNVAGSVITPAGINANISNSIVIGSGLTTGALTVLSSTAVLLGFINSSTVYSVVLSIAASVITPNAFATVDVISSPQFYGAIAISASLAMATYVGGGVVRVNMLSISGTTVASANITKIPSIGIGNPIAVPSSTSSGRIYSTGSGFIYTIPYSISGTNITILSILQGNFLSSLNSNSIAAFNASAAVDIIGYIDANNYAAAIPMEYVK